MELILCMLTISYRSQNQRSYNISLLKDLKVFTLKPANERELHRHSNGVELELNEKNAYCTFKADHSQVLLKMESLSMSIKKTNQTN